MKADLGGTLVWLNVDSGASRTVIDSAYAQRQKLRVRPLGKATGVGGTTSDAGVTDLDRMTVGGFAAGKSSVAVADLSGATSHVSFDRQSLEIAGLLGADFLAAHQSEISFGEAQLRIRDAGLKSRAVMRGLWRIKWHATPGGEPQPLDDRLKVASVSVDATAMSILCGSSRVEWLISEGSAMSESPYYCAGYCRRTVAGGRASKSYALRYAAGGFSMSITALADALRAGGLPIPPSYSDDDIVVVVLHRVIQ